MSSKYKRLLIVSRRGAASPARPHHHRPTGPDPGTSRRRMVAALVEAVMAARTAVGVRTAVRMTRTTTTTRDGGHTTGRRRNPNRSPASLTMTMKPQIVPTRESTRTRPLVSHSYSVLSPKRARVTVSTSVEAPLEAVKNATTSQPVYQSEVRRGELMMVFQ